MPAKYKPKTKQHCQGAQRGAKAKKKGRRCCPNQAEAQEQKLDKPGNEQTYSGGIDVSHEPTMQNWVQSEHQGPSQQVLETHMSDNVTGGYESPITRPPGIPTFATLHEPPPAYSTAECAQVFNEHGLPDIAHNNNLPLVLQSRYQSYAPSTHAPDGYWQLPNAHSSFPQHGHPANGVDQRFGQYSQQHNAGTGFQYQMGQNTSSHGASADNNAGLLGVAASAAEDANFGSDSNTMHNCTCGSFCNCVGCSAHPYNEATRQYLLTSATQTTLDDMIRQNQEPNQADVDQSGLEIRPSFDPAMYDTYTFSRAEAERLMNPETLQHAHSAGAFERDGGT